MVRDMRNIKSGNRVESGRERVTFPMVVGEHHPLEMVMELRPHKLSRRNLFLAKLKYFTIGLKKVTLPDI